MSRDPRSQIRRLFTAITDSIAASATYSTGIDKRGWNAVGLILPTMDNGAVGFSVSMDNATWVVLNDPPGTALSLGTTTGSCAVAGSGTQMLAAWPYVRVTCAAQTGGSRALTWTLQG
jgi:hypothetical protein